MKRAVFALLLIAAAVAAGLAGGELLYRWPAARELIARWVGRGELLALVDGGGIYEGDGEAEQLIITANLRRESRDGQIRGEAVERELGKLQHQFGDVKVFNSELESSGLSSARLGESLREHLQAQQWIEQQIAPELEVGEAESRAFYEANTERFAQPPRFRVNHLFLAAPEATPPELVQAKGEAIKSISKRLSKGEDFAQLIAAVSEDEATKERGGDLGFFSASRMPPEFVAEIQKLRPGRRAAPVRLPLGFHILQLTDARPARQMAFEEVRAEITLHLANARRAAAVERLRQRLAGAEFIRTEL